MEHLIASGGYICPVVAIPLIATYTTNSSRRAGIHADVLFILTECHYSQVAPTIVETVSVDVVYGHWIIVGKSQDHAMEVDVPAPIIYGVDGAPCVARVPSRFWLHTPEVLRCLREVLVV
jgi:hypothetical protein